MSLAWRPRVPPNARRGRAGLHAKVGGAFPPAESLDSVVPAATVAARTQARVPPGSAANGSAVTTQARVGSANGAATPSLSPGTRGPGERQPATGPIDWLMSNLIRKLAWSKLSEPRMAIAVSGVGLLLGMVVGATAQNTETLPLRLSSKPRSEEHTSELQSRQYLVCRLLLEKKIEVDVLRTAAKE